MSELLMIEQRQGRDDNAPWIREAGQTMAGHDSNLRLAALREGLIRHAEVRPVIADAGDEEVELALAALHDRSYLEALGAVGPEGEVVMAEFAPPGLEPDIPVRADLVAAAREGVRTSITAAARILAGARFTYAVCRPPGHHAGPDFLGGYCYLNNAAAALQTLCAGGMHPVGVLDLDLHYPNGTSALVGRIEGATLHSLHAAPVTNVAAGTVLPQVRGERALAFEAAPDPETYLAEVNGSVATLAESARALVVSLGYDTVAGDPHGSWDFPPSIFFEVGASLARSGLPVCVIQEGGYDLGSLAECSHAFASGLLGGGGE